MSRFAEVFVTPDRSGRSRFAEVLATPEWPDDECDQRGEDSAGGEATGSLPIRFTEDDLRQGLLRGVPAHEIVAGAGKHWKATSQQSDAGKSWAFSKPVRRNAVFISHSWAASRWLKYLALLMYFNGRAATIAAFVAAVVAMFVDFFFPIESLRFVFMVDKLTGCTFVYTAAPFIAGNTVGAIVFVAGQHFRRFFEAARLLPPKTTFLDKLVIHQDNPELMQRGINLLGAFIHSSDVFLVLWSREYLTRLWCSYEVAVFAHMKRDADFPSSFCALPLPITMVVGGKVMGAFLIGIVYIFIMGCVGLHTKSGVAITGWLFTIVWPLVNIPSTAGLLGLLQATHDMQHQVRKYDLCETQCFNPADRESVEGAITAWFEPRSRERAIDKFNDFVRGDFQASIGQLFNDSGTIHWTLAMAASLPNAYYGVLATLNNFPCVYSWTLVTVLVRVVQDVPLSMLVVNLQFRAVRCLERCGQKDSDYEAVSGQRGAGAQSSLESSSRRRPFVLHLVVCTLIDWTLNAMFSLTLFRPTNTIYAAFMLLLTLYVHW